MRQWPFVVLLLLVVITAVSTPLHSETATAVTVSGTITGPGGAVEDVLVHVGTPQDWQETSSNAAGFYSATVQTNGQLWINVRPPLASGLTQANQLFESVSSSFTQNFALQDGYLLDVTITTGGQTLTNALPIEINPLQAAMPDNNWYQLDWQDSSHNYQAVLPPDVYGVLAYNPPDGYFDTTAAYDLRTAGETAVLPLNTQYVHPIPKTPPDASKITIGAVDSLGEATISGAAGAALPLARVLLVNLNSTHQSHTISEADGSFTAQLYAPPGSAVMVKHGPASERWHDLDMGVSEGINPFPGTIINVPPEGNVVGAHLPFAAVGAVDTFTDDVNTTRNYVGAAWAISGTLQPTAVDGEWTRLWDGDYEGVAVPGLYQGGLNWTHPALADLDDDGDVDLVVGEQWGHLVLYRNEGTAVSPDWVWQTADFASVNTGGWAYPALVDVTGDDALDLFVGSGNGQVTIYYNDGTPANPAWPATPDAVLAAGDSAAPALDDLDGDGDLDLLVGHGGGTLYYYRNIGSAAAPAWTYQTDSYASINEGGNVQPAFVNLDGDTDLDLLLGLCGSLIWYERGGTAVSPTWTRHAADPIGYGGGSCGNSPGVADWNDDTLPDLTIGEHWGNLRFFYNDAPSGWIEESFEFPFDLSGDSAPALGDWDNDGDLDLLIGQAHGEVQQYRNDGTAAAADWQSLGALLTLPWTNHPHPMPTLADIDDDDDLDLFIGEGDWDGPDSGGTLRYYENLGTPGTPNWQLVTTNWLGLDVGGWSSPVFADIDNDNDLDLFVGNGAGTLTFVQNTGTPTVPAWAAPQQPYANLQLGAYSAPAFLDVDDDGDLDLLVGLAHGSMAYVRNTGTANAPAWELVATEYPGIDVGDNARPVAADWDDDSDADLLIGDGDGGLDVYLYDGPGTPPTDNDYAPGEQFQASGTLRLYGPAIDATTDVGQVSVQGWLSLKMLGREDGRFLPTTNYFMSTMTTPTGFPIQQNWRSYIGTGGAMLLENWQFDGGHTLSADFIISGQIPADAPPGFYRPVIWLDFSGVPTDQTWLAANVTQYTYETQEAPLPPITINGAAPPRLNWRLLMEDFVQGMRGVGAQEDAGDFGLATQIVTQSPTYAAPRTDVGTGQPIAYRLEPFLPAISFTDRRMPGAPLLPFTLPGGELCVSLTAPDNSIEDLGCAPFQQSLNRSSTTRTGGDLNSGTVQLEDVYSLTTNDEQFVVTFAQNGRYTIHMSGSVSDWWGNVYEGGGTYAVWVAEPLDIDPGVLPGTPLAVGDAFNPAMQVYPRVPADVTLTLTHYPDSDPAQMETYTVSGQANEYGAFAPTLQAPITLSSPGEFRVDVTAVYTATDGTLYLGSLAWGSVVMTPDNQADLVAHGRRGVDSLSSIPTNWFVSCRDLPIQAGVVSHTLNPYYNGDVLWTRMMDAVGECPVGVNSGGDSLVLGASVQDTVGVVETAVQTRAARMNPELYQPGDFNERLTRGEIPLFSSTYSGLSPNMVPGDLDQIAYSYRSSQRPGVRVREVVAEDGQSGGYWRLDTLYDNQLGVGILGDQPNDFKFQYVGVVYRDLVSGFSEYDGQGTGWVFIPDSDITGSRAMPPFAGTGNGGWTTEGGPLLTLLGEDIDIFIFPTGTKPGAVLEVGDTFRFAGHIMPTLDSQVAVMVTAPGGATHTISGQANRIGYFYDAAADFVVNEPGLWSVDVQVWHDGQCSGGSTVPPYPSGDVLGSENGRYYFYVVPQNQPPLTIMTPAPGSLSFDTGITPIDVSGFVPAGLSNPIMEVTTVMPGTILQHEAVVVDGNGRFTYTYDPVTLQQDFPNLDLMGRGDWRRRGLADTVAINLFVRGQQDGQPVAYAATVTLQGEQVFMRNGAGGTAVYLPVVVSD